MIDDRIAKVSIHSFFQKGKKEGKKTERSKINGSCMDPRTKYCTSLSLLAAEFNKAKMASGATKAAVACALAGSAVAFSGLAPAGLSTTPGKLTNQRLSLRSVRPAKVLFPRPKIEVSKQLLFRRVQPNRQCDTILPAHSRTCF